MLLVWNLHRLCDKIVLIASGHSGEVIPVPIPNTEVKLSYADDTALQRESRKLLAFFFGRLAQLVRASGLHPECREFDPLTVHKWPFVFLQRAFLLLDIFFANSRPTGSPCVASDFGAEVKENPKKCSAFLLTDFLL